VQLRGGDGNLPRNMRVFRRKKHTYTSDRNLIDIPLFSTCFPGISKNKFNGFRTMSRYGPPRTVEKQATTTTSKRRRYEITTRACLGTGSKRTAETLCARFVVPSRDFTGDRHNTPPPPPWHFSKTGFRRDQSDLPTPTMTMARRRRWITRSH